jgi:hypothetical protein
MNTPKYETNKYRSYREAFEGGVSETMKLNNVISIEDLNAEIDRSVKACDISAKVFFELNMEISETASLVIKCALINLREFINSKINQERNE